jgi:membrane protein YqaA with SNARE-associated domain
LRSFLFQIAWTLYALGGIGLLIMGVLDSSFLFMPLGNDLLVIALTARHEARMPYYAAMATAGSVLGVLLIDIISRKGGEKGLEGRVPEHRLEYLKQRIRRRAGWAISFAALMPPPFPFTPFIVVAAALQYPRRRLLAVVAASRLVRFSVAGALAIVFGRRILQMAESPALQYGVVALVLVSVAGSAFSIYSWIKRSKHKPAHGAPGAGKARAEELGA